MAALLMLTLFGEHLNIKFKKKFVKTKKSESDPNNAILRPDIYSGKGRMKNQNLLL